MPAVYAGRVFFGRRSILWSEILRIPGRPRTAVTVLRSKRSRPSVRSPSAQSGIHDGLPNVAPGDILFFRGDNLILDKAKHFGMRLGPVGPPAGSILGDGHRKI